AFRHCTVGRMRRRHGAQAGRFPAEPSAQSDIERAFRNLLAEAALRELGRQRALELIALVEEGERRKGSRCVTLERRSVLKSAFNGPARYASSPGQTIGRSMISANSNGRVAGNVHVGSPVSLAASSRASS